MRGNACEEYTADFRAEDSDILWAIHATSGTGAVCIVQKPNLIVCKNLILLKLIQQMFWTHETTTQDIGTVHCFCYNVHYYSNNLVILWAGNL